MKTFLQCNAFVKKGTNDKIRDTIANLWGGVGVGVFFATVCKKNLQKTLTKDITFIK